MSIEAYQPRSELVINAPQDVAVHRLAEWAQSADAAYGVAQRLSESSFVPQQFRNKPVELTAAILAGLEVGLSPMAAMRSFDIIQGTAAARAITLRAVVQAAGHEMELLESTNTRCRMRGRRKGSQEWQSVTWTIERARDLGLVGKDNWKKQPAAMLIARATSELARLVASDAILGIGYSSEEVADGVTDDSVTTTPQASTGTRTMSRRPPVAPEPSDVELPADGGPLVAPEELPDSTSEPAPESPLLDMRSKLAKRLFAVLNEAGIPDAEQRECIVAIIGREIQSRKELTDADAETVIAALEATLEQPFPSGDAS